MKSLTGPAPLSFWIMRGLVVFILGVLLSVALQMRAQRQAIDAFSAAAQNRAQLIMANQTEVLRREQIIIDLLTAPPAQEPEQRHGR